MVDVLWMMRSLDCARDDKEEGVGMTEGIGLFYMNYVKKVVMIQPFGCNFVYLQKFGIYEVSEYQKGIGSMAGVTTSLGER